MEKYKKKKEYFIKTLLIIFYIIPMAFYPKNYILVLLILVFMISKIKNELSKKELSKIKEKLIKSKNTKYFASKKINKSKIGLILIIGIIIPVINSYIIKYSYLIVSDNLLIIILESLIILFFIVKNYIKFIKITVYTDKAKLVKQELVEISNFLKDYSLIENRKSIEIHLWDYYLMLSVLLNINKTIPNELKIKFFDNNNNNNKIHFDYYENKYYIINDKNEKIYVEEKADL